MSSDPLVTSDPSIPDDPCLRISGLIVQPIAERLGLWHADGKISEEDLDEALSEDARSLIDHSLAAEDWVPIEEVESLVALVAQQIGGETGLVDWAEEIVGGWRSEASVEELIRAAGALVDAPGFVVSQMCGWLLREADWFYEGGRTAFSVRLSGLGEVSPALKALLGALLARLAGTPTRLDFDVRFDGIDGDDLVVFGEVPGDDDGRGESRLHRAALIA